VKAKGIEAPDFPIFPPWEQVLNYLGSRSVGDLLVSVGFCFPKQKTRPGKRLHFANWKDPPFLMEKLTILTGPFSIAMLVYQRVVAELLSLIQLYLP
jgi:hypothetical protein